MISPTINEKIAQALKAKDEIRLSTLRLLSSALNYEKIAKQHELSEDEENAVVKREAKKRQDAIEALRLAQGKPTSSVKSVIESRLEQENKELAILKEFLPEDMGEDELKDLVDKMIAETGASGMQDFGKVMGAVMAKVRGRADGNKVAEMVKSKL